MIEQKDIQSIRVISLSRKGHKHTTVKFTNGTWWCSCTMESGGPNYD